MLSNCGEENGTCGGNTILAAALFFVHLVVLASPESATEQNRTPSPHFPLTIQSSPLLRFRKSTLPFPASMVPNSSSILGFFFHLRLIPHNCVLSSRLSRLIFVCDYVRYSKFGVCYYKIRFRADDNFSFVLSGNCESYLSVMT